MNFRLAAVVASYVGLAALPCTAAIVEVNGSADVPGVSYQRLSGAVAYVQSLANDRGPHTIKITTDDLTAVADGPIVISQPMSINGDGNGNDVMADILVDMDGIQTGSNPGQVDSKCFLEIQTPGTVIISDLKIHPNADCNAIDSADSVDAIRLYEPAGAGETSRYILNRVWVSGSDQSNKFVDLTTADVIYGATPKKWSFTAGTGTVASGTNAVIQVLNNGAGTCAVELNNCMAGLGESNALNIGSHSGSTIVSGGLYGHVARDGIRIVGDGVTLTGSPTNRLRVVRPCNIGGGDGHAVEVYDDARVALIEFVDIAAMNTAQALKVWGNEANATVDMVRFCRTLGKLPSPEKGANNPAVLVKGMAAINEMRDCTILGTAGTNTTKIPLQTDADISRDIHIIDCIFASEAAGAINALNADNVGGIRTLSNCALPTDGYSRETLADPPISGSGARLINVANAVNSSPKFVQTLAQYDWSEAAVSVGGFNSAAGNPDVLRPSSPEYKGKASTGGDLIGGAGPVQQGN